MKILYITSNGEDYLQDGILYGLRKRFGENLVDYPKKEVLYKSKGNMDIYGKGFTLWGNLDDIKVDRDDMYEKLQAGIFDVVVFSSIYRQQPVFAEYVNHKLFEIIPTKWVFLDGEDDGFPSVGGPEFWGTYFKRENPHNNPRIKIVGLSIPAEKMLTEPPKKTKPFATHVQCREAYLLQEVMDNCTENPVFAHEQDYYWDLSCSKYGITMKKSGWDVPRHVENASHYVVNCIFNRAWDGSTWADKPAIVHPLGLEDMKNCIIWDTPEELAAKIKEADKNYERISEASRRWADQKSCEYMSDYILKNI